MSAKNKTIVMPVPGASTKGVTKGKTKKKSTVRVTPGMNFSATMDNEIARHAKGLVMKMQASEEMSMDGIGFVQHSLNPCGEHTVPNSRCTDGTLAQSAVQTLRAEDFVRPPFANDPGVVPDTTKNWTLVEISPPTYTGISLLIASADARQPTNNDYKVIFTQLNSTGVLDYPAWTPIGTTNINYYVSYWRYEAANLLYDPVTNQSTTVESFRYVGDGIVLRHNCPDLWNQGGFVTGQFQCDTEYISQPGEIATVTIQTSNTTLASNQVTLANLSIATTVENVSFLSSTSNIIVSSTVPATVPNVVFGQPYSIRKPDGNFLVNVGANAVFSWTLRYIPVGSLPARLEISTSSTEGGPYSINLTSAPIVDVNTYTTTPILGAVDAVASVIIDLPSLSWSNIVQADPKRGSDLMKGHSGFYSVRRFFQPKLLMQKSNVSGNVKFLVPGMDRLAAVQAKGGILNELIDRNGSIRVSVIRGISYAAEPQMKCDRFIELMPAPGSILASVTEVTPLRDEDAEEIFRSLQARGAHAYVPDANFLGTMAIYLSTLVSRIPVFLRTVRSISSAIDKAAEYAQEKTKFLE